MWTVVFEATYRPVEEVASIYIMHMVFWCFGVSDNYCYICIQSCIL